MINALCEVRPVAVDDDGLRRLVLEDDGPRLLVEAHVLRAVHLRDALVVPADLGVHHHPAPRESQTALL